MNNQVWINNRQPQTLYIAQILLYVSAVGALIFHNTGAGVIDNSLGQLVVVLLLTFGAAGGAFGIANERKWGYRLGIAAAIAPFIVRLVVWRRFGLDDAIQRNLFGLVFDVAALAALLHRMSGEYQRIYFR
ncbi:MAG: hypothetical protein R2707_04690 [Acidimicrobiales bacterium]